MVTSFKHYNDGTDRRTDVGFYLSHGLVQVCELITIHLLCPCSIEISQPRVGILTRDEACRVPG